jgi:zinc/manganese transport system permease protein
VLVVANLVAGFQALGTLMAVGLLMLPAIAARFWVHDVGQLSALAGAFATVSGYVGLLLSFHAALPSGPAIVLVAPLPRLDRCAWWPASLCSLTWCARSVAAP